MFAYGKGTEQSGFKEVWMQITAYMQGSLGRVLVGLIVVVGIAAAVVRQSLMTLQWRLVRQLVCTTHRISSTVS